ncbi:hypothetical protein DID88_009053 [Monilinia fructigena]|uniref:Uncharacterized protein n=1 Tax=Monilinia fructigena TaxID=38457 RepID=A0A395IGH2_9HELO|nr:hypothetical protein DID88_009053 [Monilinia fructigena]
MNFSPLQEMILLGEEQVATNDGGSSSPARNGAGKSAVKKGGKKGGRRNDESEEEGEASSGDETVRSERSAPMDESDSDSDGPSFRDDADRYPLEGKFMNASDKANIMSMPEIEREQVLADRAQEIERDRQNRALRQLLNARDAENKKADKKRKAGAAELDENQRKTSRQRTKLGGGKVGEASTGIDSLKRARAEKNDRQRRRDEDKERHKGDSRRDHRDDYSDDDADGDSEIEWTASKTKKRRQIKTFTAWDLLKASKEDRPYAMMSNNGKQFSTTQYVIAAHGKSERSLWHHPQTAQRKGSIPNKTDLPSSTEQTVAKNIEEVRQAQINERRAARLAEAAIARGEFVDEDHSRRVKTRATFKHDHTGGKDSATATPVSGTSTNNTPKLAAKKDALPVPNFSKLQTSAKGGVPGFRRPLMDDDIIASIDIGISDDLEL